MGGARVWAWLLVALGLGVPLSMLTMYSLRPVAVGSCPKVPLAVVSSSPVVTLVVEPPSSLANVSAALWADVLGTREAATRHDDPDALHVIYQVPLLHVTADATAAHVAHLKERQAEYVHAIRTTMEHAHVARVHLLTEEVQHQFVLYELFPSRLHHKMRTHNIHRRLTFADAVQYANRHLADRVVAISTSDTSVAGAGWRLLKRDWMRSRFLGLTRHELKGCAMTCDCGAKYDGCHDTFVFVPPLRGGDELLEQIAFRVGGLWGSENRFMHEVKTFNPALELVNPCRGLVMQHWHCVMAGEFRPAQDHRRVNHGGKSVTINPTDLVVDGKTFVEPPM